MQSTHVSRRSSRGSGTCGVVMLGLLLLAGRAAIGNEESPTNPVFASQAVSLSTSRLLDPAAQDQPAAAAVRGTIPQSPLPDLDAGELFPAESFAEAAAMPGCTTVASLAERLLGSCLRQGLSAQEQQLAARLLFSAGQPNRTDAWSRDTESLYRLAQCAGSLADQRLVAGAALAAAEAELQRAATATPGRPLPECRRDHAQRAVWLWTYRLAALDVAQGHYLRAAAALLRLHRTAPNRSLLAVVADARNHLVELHAGEMR